MQIKYASLLSENLVSSFMQIDFYWVVLIIWSLYFSFQVLKTFPSTTKYLKSKFLFLFRFSCQWCAYWSNIFIFFYFLFLLKDFICLFVAIVSFGKVAPNLKEEFEKYGLEIFSWDEFLLLVSIIFDLLAHLHKVTLVK